MSIVDHIASKLNQTITYWANPVNDGYGSFSFDAAVELSARWEQVNEVVRANDGEEYVTIARVFLSQEVEEGEYIYLGQESDLDSNHGDPQAQGALRVLAVSILPELNNASKLMYVAHLNKTASRAV